MKVFTGQVPYYGLSDVAVIRALLQHQLPKRPATLSEGRWERLQGCWAADPAQRATASSLLISLGGPT